MKEILLIGGGGHCKSCIDVIELEGNFQISGIIDNTLYENGVKEILGYPILGKDKDLQSLRDRYQYAFIAIGQIKTPLSRIKLYSKLKALGYIIPIIVSPLSHIAKNVKIDEGTIVMHHTLLNTSSKVGKMCIINTKALIEHDCVVEDFCHISTGAILNGGCQVGEKSFIASNMAIKQDTKIASNSVVYINQSKMGGGDKHKIIPTTPRRIAS